MRALFLCLVPGVALADPAFGPRPLPIEHVYSGGWEHFVGGGVAVLDCNGDGFDDLFMAGGAAQSSLLINTTKTQGADITFRQHPVSLRSGVTGAYPLDFDSDGTLDLMVLRVGENVILENDGACGFSRANEKWGLDGGDRWTTAFSATWEAGQDWPTLAFGNYVDRDDPDGPFEACDSNALFRHDGSTFVKTALQPGFCALSMLFSDWNRDGTQDLRVSNDRHYYVSGGSEQMWAMPGLTLMNGDGWEPISIWGMGIASRDFTGDGRPEVVLTSMGDQLMQISGESGYSAAPFSIGTYAQRPYIGDEGRPSTGWHAQFADVNNDARADLFIAKGNVDQMPGMATKDPNNLLIQGEDGTFVERGDIAGVASVVRSRGAALSDLNRDGLLDIVVVNRRAPAELYQNLTPNAGGWVGVALRQRGSNTQAVGAWVEMSSGGVTQTQEVTVGGGHAGGQSGMLHFGLGTQTSASLRVLWPDGETSDWIDATSGQVINFDR